MISLSTRTKEAIKTALAMTIAYGIALSMDWPNAKWAAFAVAFISLSTVGQSINKGAMRITGTLAAAAFTLTLIAVFPQDRWWFMLGLTVFVGFCTYMNAGGKRQYFWFVAGFSSVIIGMGSVPATDDVFQLAVVRTLETGLGILVYTLVTILLWPTNTRATLDEAISGLWATQQALFRRYRKLLGGEGEAADTDPLRMQLVQQFNQFNQALASAQTDTYEVWEVRAQWQQVQKRTKQVMETLERWRESLNEVQDLDLAGLLPNLDALGDELEARFEQVARMLAGNAPERSPKTVNLRVNNEAARNLSHFQQAALAVTEARLRHLEALTRALFDTLADIKGLGPSSPQPTDTPGPQPRFVLDADRLAAAVRVMAGLWLAYLAWIYTEVPGGTSFVVMMGPFGMILATTPQIRVSALFVPTAVGVASASVLYIFVMPHLSSFAELGPLIFVVTFAFCYLYAAPRQALGRAFGLAMFATIAAISNQQTYSFLAVANTALMFPLIFALLALAAYIPFSARPEKAFLRLLGRFFRSCEYLMTTMRWDLTMTPTRLDRWRQAFHLREVETMPQKITAWGRAVDTKALPGTTPERVQALTTNLQALAYRMQELLEARESPQATLLVRELLADVRAWRLRVQEVFQSWSRDPGPTSVDVLRDRLAARLGHLERRIQETLNKAPVGELSDQDSQRLYRLLGAYRGLSEAGIEYAGTAEGIDWRRWRETRF